MAAKKATTKKRATASKSTKVIKTQTSVELWWKQYSYTPGEVVTKFLILAILVYVMFQYRGLLVAATVNGRPISRVSVIKELETTQGQSVLENLINQELIRQKAKSSYVEVTQQDIDSKLSEIETSLKDSGQTLDAVLAMQGMTKDVLVDQIKTQIMVEKLLEGDITVSDEDITGYLAQNKDYLPKDQTEDQLKTLALEQLRQQKLSERFSTWITEVKNEAKIDKYVAY